jgi:predicted O-methyltransferase YrrM
LGAVDEFAALIPQYPYRAKGMFYSEVFLFLLACEAQQVTRVVESGVNEGMSTALLATRYAGRMWSIDQRRVRVPRGVTFVYGDATALMPDVLRHAKGRIGVLIDGPKGDDALALKEACWANRRVKVVAVHDVPVECGATQHSHSPEYRCLSRLDASIPSDYRATYPDGPGLGVWVR